MLVRAVLFARCLSVPCKPFFSPCCFSLEEDTLPYFNLEDTLPYFNLEDTLPYFNLEDTLPYFNLGTRCYLGLRFCSYIVGENENNFLHTCSGI